MHSAENYIGGHMISTISNRQPSQVLYEALDYEIPVSTGAQRKISVSSFFLFSTASVKLRRRVMSAARLLNPQQRSTAAPRQTAEMGHHRTHALQRDRRDAIASCCSLSPSANRKSASRLSLRNPIRCFDQAAARAWAFFRALCQSNRP